MQKHHEYASLLTRRDSRTRPVLRPDQDDSDSRQIRRGRHSRLAVEQLEQRTLLSLVAAYNFNEGSGSILTDLSANGNNGTISNATWTSSGKYGGALVFNGKSSMVTINDSASLNLTTGMTLEAWVNPTTVSSAWRDVIFKSDSLYYLEATSPTKSDTPAAGGTFSNGKVTTYGTSSLSKNAWTFLTATYNGSNLLLYVNGTQVSSLAHTGNIVTSTNALQLGGDSLYGEFLSGMIDNVRIYNTALTSAQIQTDMKTPINTVPIVTSETPTPGATGVVNTTSVTATSPSGSVTESWCAIRRP